MYLAKTCSACNFDWNVNTIVLLGENQNQDEYVWCMFIYVCMYFSILGRFTKIKLLLEVLGELACHQKAFQPTYHS